MGNSCVAETVRGDPAGERLGLARQLSDRKNCTHASATRVAWTHECDRRPSRAWRR